jgi:hypothetical protein
VHWGRVNTNRRIRHCIATGACDSLDGTKWARWRTTYLDDGLEFIRHEAAATRLDIAA